MRILNTVNAIGSGASTQNWSACMQSQTVTSSITKTVGNVEECVEIALWVHPNADIISEGWAADKVKVGNSKIVIRPSTHQLTISIKPGIQLFNEPCSIGIEMSGSVQVMHRAELDLRDDGCTRLTITDSYKIKDLSKLFSKGKCFGLLVFQANEKKWAQFFPELTGFDECHTEMNNQEFLPPANAA